MPRQTIADIVAAVLREREEDAVMSGDIGLLDEIAVRCDKELGTKLCTWDGRQNPDRYHTRILDACQTKRGKLLFEKRKLAYEGCRVFVLKEKLAERENGNQKQTG